MNDENISYSEKLLLLPDDYANIPISNLPLSVRVLNRLAGIGIITLADLLRKTPGELGEINGWGQSCFDSVEKVLSELQNEDFQVNYELIENGNKPLKKAHLNPIFKLHRDEVLNEDFSFVEEIDNSEEINENVENLLLAYKTIGKTLANDCCYNFTVIRDLINVLSSFNSNISKQIEVQKEMEIIPHHRLKNEVKFFIQIFKSDETTKNKIMRYFESEVASLNSANIEKVVLMHDDMVLIKRFFRSCAYNIKEEIESFFSEAFSKSEKSEEVLNLRKDNYSLDYIGTEFGITRERVRQIEKKIRNKFSNWITHSQILEKLAADKNDSIITINDIEKFSLENAKLFWYLLKVCDSETYCFDAKINAVIVGNNALSPTIQCFIDELPETFSQRDLGVLLELAEYEGLPLEIIERHIKDTYQISGSMYHINRITLTDIYKKTMSDFYPNGLKVYDEEQVLEFYEHILECYGDVDLPDNTHALASQIARVCILCDKGTYKLKQNNYVPDSLAQKIREYIEFYEYPVILISSIYSEFEQELQSSGVTNRYYLQGILRELYGNELFFRRDYVYKDKSAVSFYDNVVDYIRKNLHVTKDQIKNIFPGITDIMFSFATSDPSVLNFFGEYLHADALNLSPLEREYLHETFERVLGDNNIHNIEEIFKIISGENPTILSSNFVRHQYSMFSLAEYLFGDEYQFVRPYVAKFGVEMSRVTQ